jgi:hypothetical protein
MTPLIVRHSALLARVFKLVDPDLHENVIHRPAAVPLIEAKGGLCDLARIPKLGDPSRRQRLAVAVSLKVKLRSREPIVGAPVKNSALLAIKLWNAEMVAQVDDVNRDEGLQEDLEDFRIFIRGRTGEKDVRQLGRNVH